MNVARELNEILTVAKCHNVKLTGGNFADITCHVLSVERSPNMSEIFERIMAQYSKGQHTCGDDCQCALSPAAAQTTEQEPLTMEEPTPKA